MSGARNGLRDRLRQATRLSHDRLDAALDLLGPPVTLAEYRALLGRHHGIHRALEPVLTRTLEHALVAGHVGQRGPSLKGAEHGGHGRAGIRRRPPKSAARWDVPWPACSPPWWR